MKANITGILIAAWPFLTMLAIALAVLTEFYTRKDRK